MKDIRVVAVDLDDTLLRSDKTLADTTRDLLLEWIGRGNHVIVATGRPPRTAGESLPPEMWQLPWVVYNGAEIRLNGEVIYSDLLKAEDSEAVVHSLLDRLPGAPVGVEIDDVLYLNQRWDRPYHYEVADLRTMAYRPTAKILFFHDDPSTLDGMFDDIPAGAKVMISDKYKLVQIMAKNVDKVIAIRRLVEQWGLDMSNVLAIGDDINDISMVQESGIGVAVGNAIDEVKAVADRVTLSNDEGGVDLILEELLAQT